MESVGRSADHLRLWLAAAGSTYGNAAREGFARAHPTLFGAAYEVTLRGYERWRMRHGVSDSELAFARYLAPRHERWLVAQASTHSVAPCLIPTANGQPCWRAEAAASALDLRAAA